MFFTKVLALIALLSWLASTSDRIYVNWQNTAESASHLPAVKAEGWSLSKFRW